MADTIQAGPDAGEPRRRHALHEIGEMTFGVAVGEALVNAPRLIRWIGQALVSKEAREAAQKFKERRFPHLGIDSVDEGIHDIGLWLVAKDAKAPGGNGPDKNQIDGYLKWLDKLHRPGWGDYLRSLRHILEVAEQRAKALIDLDKPKSDPKPTQQPKGGKKNKGQQQPTPTAPPAAPAKKPEDMFLDGWSVVAYHIREMCLRDDAGRDLYAKSLRFASTDPDDYGWRYIRRTVRESFMDLNNNLTWLKKFWDRLKSSRQWIREHTIQGAVDIGNDLNDLAGRANVWMDAHAPPARAATGAAPAPRSFWARVRRIFW